ncbi:putative DNA primase [Xylophilus phage Lumi]|nr:putative DNA primase [Xylophilus phage Lumi]
MEQLPIFAENAPRHYAAGLQVIPLFAREKKPIPADWSRFHNIRVEPEQQQEWIARMPTANMGLVLGESSGLIMIDIDTDDAALFDAIMAVLPPSPWMRKGAKGMMLAYKWTPIKTHRIKNLSGETLVETLSSKTQCVLPPSIHPTTQKPYAANCELIDCLGKLNVLPEDIETKLRQALTNAGVQLSHSGWSKVTEFTSAGSRDTTMTELSGLFAYAVVRGERTLRESIGMLQSYGANFIENVAGDPVDIDKHVNNLIKFLHRDVLDKGKVLPRGWDTGYDAEELRKMGVTLGINETEWTFEEVKTFLQQKFEEHADGKPRADAVEEILLKLSRSKQLTKIDEERILKYIFDVSGLNVGMATLRARLRELRSGDVLGNDHSEIARAVLKDLEQWNIVRYHREKFMKWNGSHWIEYDKNTILQHISSRYGHLPACKKSSDINGIIKVMSFITEQGIERRPVMGVNCANGFLTQELKLLPHDPDYGMTYTLPYRYMQEEAGKFPNFAQFLNRSWGLDSDYEDKQLALQEALCVTLFGIGPRFQKAVLLHGAPRSGKTQLLRIVESIVPAEAKSSVPPTQWNDKFLPAMMANKILNICGELSSKKLIDGQIFKDIIDGSEMAAQFKNQQIFHFKPMVTHWFASNHIPKSEDTSVGFIRRWLFLTFHFPVPEDQTKVDIGDEIAALEREAIVAWAAEAMPRLLARNRYTLPKSHMNIVNDFANINNSVRFFLKESGKTHIGNPDNFTDEQKLYNSYWTFCAGPGGVKAANVSIFRQMMRELSAELPFRLKISPGRAGMSQAIYEGITMI